jgi:gamma-glutamyltranspeptidase/glutathione hydrolase
MKEKCPLEGIGTFMARPAVMGRHGMIASAHPLASNAGLDILKAGGNAFDAAVATNAVLNVTQPHMCGIGGDVFYLLYSSKDKKVTFMNGSGRSAHLATRSFYTKKGYESIPLRGPLSMVTVPGCVDAWHQVLKKYGTMEFRDLLRPAIEYADLGHPTSHQLSTWVGMSAELNRQSNHLSLFLRNGRPLKAGELLVQSDLAETFRAIAEEGRDAFYKGEIAKRIAKFCQENGGVLREQDFEDHRSTWDEPIHTDYRGYRIYQTPPNTQGITALLEFNIIEGFDLKAMGHNSSSYLHHLCEAKKLAFADRDRYVTDPEFFDIPVEKLLDKNYATKCRAFINANSALPNNISTGNPYGDTTYFAVVDEEQNMVSCIQSLYFPFGSGVVVEATGIIMQNRGAYFSLDPQHTNTLEPQKRTLHTLIASIVFDNENNPYLVFGTMGGDGQPQTHLTVISNILDFGMNIQQAIESPRWIHGNVTIEDPKVQFNIEGRITSNVIKELEKKGHDIHVIENWAWEVGHAQGILINKDTGVLQGGADPRGDGYVVGW